MDTEQRFKDRLTGILAEFECQTGTIHRTKPDGSTLALVCQIGVPETLLEKIASIPFGKGIAGAAAERRGPVRLCNLQTDLGGVAKPDARQTGVCGSMAVPMFSSDGKQVVGTLGIGKNTPYDFPEAEEKRLEAHARDLAADFEKENKAGCDD